VPGPRVAATGRRRLKQSDEERMEYVYWLIVLYFTAHLAWYFVREKDFWLQAGAVLLLVMFTLRLLFIK
jgi:membrane protein YdbS with pleckstrin-like domain